MRAGASLFRRRHGPAFSLLQPEVCRSRQQFPGTVGILGEDYPGYFNLGDTRELRWLLIRAEADPDFLSLLRSKCGELAGLFEPEREQKAWKDLLEELRRPGFLRKASK